MTEQQIDFVIAMKYNDSEQPHLSKLSVNSINKGHTTTQKTSINGSSDKPDFTTSRSKQAPPIGFDQEN